MKCIEIDYKKEKIKLKRLLPKTFEILENYNCYIAGGAITSLFTEQDINDVDIYFKDKTELFGLLYEKFSYEYIIYISKKAITFKLSSGETIQFIYMNYYDEAKDIFNDFDFTVNMGAFDIKKDKFILHEDFLKDIAQKKLVINTNTAFPFVTGTRILKYQQKGYTIDNLEMTKLMLTINKKTIRSYKKFEEQLGGMYGENILELTKEDKEKKFSMDNIIDKLNHYYDDEHVFNRENDEMKRILDISDDIIRWQTLLNYKLPYFEHKGDYYIYLKKDDYIKIDKEVIDKYSKLVYKMKNIENTLDKTIILYKFVHKEGDKYFSFYDQNYEYKKEVVQEPEFKNEWLYLRKYDELANATYAYEKDRALLKCAVNIQDLDSLMLNGDILTKKLKVLDIKDISNDEKIDNDLLPF